MLCCLSLSLSCLSLSYVSLSLSLSLSLTPEVTISPVPLSYCPFLVFLKGQVKGGHCVFWLLTVSFWYNYYCCNYGNDFFSFNEYFIDPAERCCRRGCTRLGVRGPRQQPSILPGMGGSMHHVCWLWGESGIPKNKKQTREEKKVIYAYLHVHMCTYMHSIKQKWI